MPTSVDSCALPPAKPTVIQNDSDVLLLSVLGFAGRHLDAPSMGYGPTCQISPCRQLKQVSNSSSLGRSPKPMPVKCMNGCPVDERYESD